MSRMEDVKRNWDEYGRVDPLYAILTDPACMGNKWDPAAFFRTGEGDVALILDNLQIAGVTVKSYGRALDFGCGVGRLTQALAARFTEAVGLDCAPSMVELAQKYDTEKRCMFVCNPDDHLRCFPDDHFDFILTRLVLQHMPRENSLKFVQEFVRVLRPGGTLVFQLPTEPLDPRPLGYAPGRPTMEMHGVPRALVEQVIHYAGGDLVCAWEDGSAHPWKGFMYVVTKEARP